MKEDAIWKIFAETGEPALYLMYKRLCAERSEEKEHARGIAPG